MATGPAAWAGPEISGFGGYQFGGRIPTSLGEIDFKDDVTYGLAMEIPMSMKPGSSPLLWYNRQETDIRVESIYGKSTLGSASINYFQAGGLYNVDQGTPVVPFTLITLHGWIGWTIFGISWGMALTGVILKLFFTGRYHLLSTLMYVCMGWLRTLVRYKVKEAGPPLALHIQSQAFNKLSVEERQLFDSEYRKRVAQAYPRHRDGRTLYPFRRLFIVARTR